MDEDDLGLALRLADVADRLSGPAHRALGDTNYTVKPDGSLVTDIDVAVEQAIVAVLADERPGDAVLGEEVGSVGRPVARTWIIDGIDGTSSFIRGESMWSTQIALAIDGVPHLGVSTSPAQQRRWWGGPEAPSFLARLDTNTTARPLSVSTTTSLGQARITSIPPREMLDGADRQLVDRLVAEGSYLSPSVHGAKLVAQGDAEACVQLRGGPWDFAALAAIVIGAGGTYSDLTGKQNLDGGGPLLFSNGHIHQQLLAHQHEPLGN